MLHFIKGALCCLTLAAVLGACADRPESGPPAGRPPDDLRLQLVDQARGAMSAHNMQPWEIELDDQDPQLMRVYLAADRLLPATDPFSRQIIMSIGGFLAVLEDAAAARGYAVRVEPFPQGVLASEDSGASFSLPVAQVRLRPSSGLTAPEYTDAVSGATVKANLAAVVLDPAEEGSYLELNSWEGVQLRFLQDAGSLSRLKPILKTAFRLEMQHEPTLLESYQLMRRNRRQLEAQPWGLSYGSNFPRKSLRLIEFFETLLPMSMEKWGLRGADNYDKEVDKAGAFLLIATSGNSRRSQLQAGMLFQRLWLKAIHDGFAVVPASQPLQEYSAMEENYRRIHEEFASPGQTIQMIAFLGRPGAGYRGGFRIPAADLIRNP